jgi:heme A synthase
MVAPADLALHVAGAGRHQPERFIRLSKAGIRCSPWPQCHLQKLGPLDQSVPPLVGEAVANARIAHRILAVATLLAVIAMLMTTVTQVAITQSRQGRQVGRLQMLALFLAVLGRWTANARALAVTLANLLAAQIALGGLVAANRAIGLALLVLLLVQGALGVALVAAGLSLAIALAHNVAAALLLAVDVSLTNNGRSLP